MFTSAGPFTFDLGSTAYTAALNSYVQPGPPGASNTGALGAIVTVAPANPGGNPITTGFGTPEPSSLLLCSLGAAGSALAGWRRRRRTRMGSLAGF